MRKILIFVTLVFSLFFVSCNAMDKMFQGLGKTGVNVLAGNKGTADANATTAKETVTKALDTITSQSEDINEAINSVVVIIESIINDTFEEDYDTYDFKDRFKDIVDAIALPDDLYDQILFDMSKVAINDNSKESFVELISEIKVDTTGLLSQIYTATMNGLKLVVETMNMDYPEEHKHKLWLTFDENTGTGDFVDLADVFANNDSPSVVDIMLISMVSNCVDSIFRLETFDVDTVVDDTKLISDVVDLYSFTTLFRSESDGNSTGMLALIDLMMEKLNGIEL